MLLSTSYGWRGVRLSVGGSRRKYELTGVWMMVDGHRLREHQSTFQYQTFRNSLIRDVRGDQLGTYIVIIGIENVHLAH